MYFDLMNCFVMSGKTKLFVLAIQNLLLVKEKA